MSDEAMYSAVFSALNESSDYKTAVGGRTYATQAPDDATLPHGVYAFATNPSQNFFSGEDIEAELQIDLYHDQADSENQLELLQINDKLYSQMHKKQMTSATLRGLQAWCIDKGVLIREGDAFRIMSRWRVMGTVS